MAEAALRAWAIRDRVAAPYLERQEPDAGWFDRNAAALWAHVAVRLTPGRGRMLRFAAAVDAAGAGCDGLTGGEVGAAAAALRLDLLTDGPVPRHVVRAFALTRRASQLCLGLRHYPVQVMGGWVMFQGMLAEMETGEGKTITALLPAVAAALAGLPVHVITVNDYLARRDATQLGPVYAMLGLSVGLAVAGQDPESRRAAYAADVTYVTNKDVAFDYLRDRIALGSRRSRPATLLDRAFRAGPSAGLLLRGLPFAIVDEADSVLIDEARTPLIISGADDRAENTGLFVEALEIAGGLSLGDDFTVVEKERRVTLTEPGRERLTALAAGRGGLWVARRAREELAEQALAALNLYHRDRQYIVADDKVKIVDEYTGRVMADRSWERGLHQMIEAKEGVAFTGRRTTLARITYQRFFRRYLRLSGMSGTVREVAPELWSVYGLKVVRIPTNRPVQRRFHGIRLAVDADRRWRAVVARVAAVAVGDGRPVLIGTRSVAASEHLAGLLAAAGIEAVVLNARQDGDEARVVAGAGQPGRVTVATNMAGRGTDIALDAGVAERGGLHVILTEVHESERIDRQLFGRGGRQGNPGSCEALLSLDDELFRLYAPRLSRLLARLGGQDGRVRPGLLARWLRRIAQGRAERAHARIRRETLRQDRSRDKLLAFSGSGE